MAYPDEGVVKGWRVDWLKGKEDSTEDQYIARRAADWELEECCKILRGEFNYHHLVEPLRAARRPKPPSLKERIATAIAHGDNSIALALLDQALPS